jgi:predicted Fe-S protein YdhL (DUF1289 family)
LEGGGSFTADYRGTYYICTRQTNHEIWIWNCETDTARQTILKQKKYSTNGLFDRKNAIGSIEPCGTSDQYSGKGLMTNLMNHLFMVYKHDVFENKAYMDFCNTQ